MIFVTFLTPFGASCNRLKIWPQEVSKTRSPATSHNWKSTAWTASSFQDVETSTVVTPTETKRTTMLDRDLKVAKSPKNLLALEAATSHRAEGRNISTCSSCGMERTLGPPLRLRHWQKGMLSTNICSKLKTPVWMFFSPEALLRTKNFREVIFTFLRMLLIRERCKRDRRDQPDKRIRRLVTILMSLVLSK